MFHDHHRSGPRCRRLEWLGPVLLAGVSGCAGEAPNYFESSSEPLPVQVSAQDESSAPSTSAGGLPLAESLEPSAGGGDTSAAINIDDEQREPADSSSSAPPRGIVRGPDPTPESASRAGPFAVVTYSSGLRDGPGYGTQTLHFPSDAEAPFASVVVVPGFASPESSIRAWGPFLASHGIVTLTIGSNNGADLPELRAAALMDAIDTIQAEDTRAGSPLEGKLDRERFAVMGWSMGGGGTLIAASAHPELRAAIGLAAWSPGATFPRDQVPTLLFAGTADILAGGQSQSFYSSIPESTPKMLYEVAGGDHGIAKTPSGADGEIGRYGLAWLKVFLEGDERYRELLLLPPARQAAFLSNLPEL